MTGSTSNRAAWCEVLDVRPGDRVLVSSDEPEAARRRLENMGAINVDLLEDTSKPCDLVVVERPTGLDILTSAWHRVSPGGQLVVVTDNGRSPLRWLDARAGAPVGPVLGSLTEVTAALADLGAIHTRVFGLLRGSSSSPTVYRTDLPNVCRAVLGSAGTNSGWLRRSAIAALANLGARGRGVNLVPAWMIVATDRERPTGPFTPTGRIGVEHNAQGVVVLGSGPDALEKFYRDPAARLATVRSLQALAEVGFTAAPRILGQPSPTRLQLDWRPGHDIDANNLSVDELAEWLGRAGSLLGDLQSRTLDDDGSVLVHGDFWLGATVADGDRLCAIIDWDDSHRGDPSVDMQTLVAVARDRSDISDVDRDRLIRAAYDGHRSAGGPAAARRSEKSEESAIRYLHIDPSDWESHGARRPFVFTHDLADDERLTQPALVDLAARMPVGNVEMNDSDLPTLFPTDDVPVLDRSPGELVARSIELRRWVALSYLEGDPQMKAMIDECLDPIAEMIGDFEGGMTGREGYVFVAPPGATTPVHLDFEHNFLLQVRGTKRVRVGFVDPAVEQRTLEEMTGGGYGRLPALPDELEEYVLEPGDGIYISPRLAHTIDTLGDDLSISFSLVFHTPWLERGARVHAANHDLRRLGLRPKPYGVSSLRDMTKSGAVTAWRSGKSLGLT